MSPTVRPIRAVAFVLLAMSVLVATPPRATAAPEDAKPGAPEDGSVAPDGCWSTVGGCPARTAAALTAPVTGTPAKAWEWTGKGEVESEPLVWGGAVYVTTCDKDDARTLTALAVTSGKVLAKKTWRGGGPLLANVWNGIVVVRAGPARIEAVRLKSDGFLAAGSIDAPGPVNDLLLFHREIYARIGGAITRFDLGNRTPVWTAGEGCAGRLALRGMHVYCVSYDSNGNGAIGCFSRTAGAQSSNRRFGHHDGKVPDRDGDMPHVQVFGEDVLVHTELGVKTEGGGTSNLADATRIRANDGSTFLADVGLFNAVSEAAAWPAGWVGSMLSAAGQPELWLSGADDRHWTLATAAANPQFANPPVPPSVAGGVAYFGGSAVDLDTRDILWTTDAAPLYRAVPARDTVILAMPGGKVVALREPRPADGKAAILAAPPEAGVQGRAVLRDGSVVAGLLQVKAGASLVVGGTPPRTIPLEDVLVAEDAAGAIFAAARADEAADGLDVIALRETAQAYAALAIQAIPTRDPALIERLAAEASTRGAEAKDVARAESQIKELTSRPKPPAVNDAEVAKIVAAEKDVAVTPARVFWERSKRLPKDAPAALVIEILSRVLDADPKHAEAGAKVRSMLPPGVVPPEPFDPRDWLSFVRATQFTPVELLKPPEPGATDITPGRRMLGMYLGVWRKDLVALQSKQLLVISAPVKPGRIANCISAGELVCDTLEGFFAAGKHVRDKRWPMTILLFENREEYLKVMGKARQSPDEQRMLEWSVGQYSPGEGARLYLPEDDDGFRRVMKTFVHELTHQWLAERCPLYSAGEGVVVLKTKGHFVVEGFAEMVEEMRFDLVRRTCRFDPASESLDTLASLPPKSVFPWKEFIGFDADDFERLSHENDIPVRGRRSLAGARKVSQGHVFYEQAAALCHYLFQGDGGKLRQAFLEYVAAHYAGRTPTTLDAFGLTEEDLGARVMAFAKSPAAK